jgi:hypothetical protein
MADGPLPKPEPKEIDEKLSLQLRHLAEDDAVLKGDPKPRILVGGQWWEKTEE